MGTAAEKQAHEKGTKDLPVKQPKKDLYHDSKYKRWAKSQGLEPMHKDIMDSYKDTEDFDKSKHSIKKQKQQLTNLSNDIKKRFSDLETSDVEFEQDAEDGDNGMTFAIMDNDENEYHLYSNSDGSISVHDMESPDELGKINNVDDFAKLIGRGGKEKSKEKSFKKMQKYEIEDMTKEIRHGQDSDTKKEFKKAIKDGDKETLKDIIEGESDYYGDRDKIDNYIDNIMDIGYKKPAKESPENIKIPSDTDPNESYDMAKFVAEKAFEDIVDTKTLPKNWQEDGLDEDNMARVEKFLSTHYDDDPDNFDIFAEDFWDDFSTLDIQSMPTVGGKGPRNPNRFEKDEKPDTNPSGEKDV